MGQSSWLLVYWYLYDKPEGRAQRVRLPGTRLQRCEHEREADTPPGRYDPVRHSLEGQLIHEYDIVAVVGMVPGDRDGYVGEVVYSEGGWWIDSGTSAIPLWSETHKLSVVGTTFKDDIEQWYGVKIPRK